VQQNIIVRYFIAVLHSACAR